MNWLAVRVELKSSTEKGREVIVKRIRKGWTNKCGEAWFLGTYRLNSSLRAGGYSEGDRRWHSSGRRATDYVGSTIPTAPPQGLHVQSF